MGNKILNDSNNISDKLKSKVNEFKADLQMEKDYKNRTICSIPKEKISKQSIIKFDLKGMFPNEKKPKKMSIENNFKKEAFINKDQPRWHQVNNTDEFPYSTIGVVSFKNTEGYKGWGTGTLIA